MHKRTTPKIFARAKELHREMTPIEVNKVTVTLEVTVT